MKKFTRRFFLGAGAATATIAASQLTRIPPVKAQSSVVNVYSSRHYDTDDQLFAAFTKATGIKVNLIEGKDDALIERIKTEGVNSPADVLMTADAGRLWRADKAGLFTAINSSVLTRQIPANLRHPQGRWFSFTKRSRVVMYNKNKVSRSQLSTYENLASAQWKGKIVVRSSSNIYNQSLVSALMKVNGQTATEQWCRGLVSNFARSPQGNDRAQIEAVASGLADLAIANTYYLPRYAPGGANANPDIFNKIGVFFPNQNGRGAHINVSGGGVVKGAPNRANGITFLEYLASSDAQALFAQGNHEYPVVAGTPIDPIIKGFGYPFKEDAQRVISYGANLTKALQIMDRAGWK